MAGFNEKDYIELVKGIGALCGTAGLIRDNMIIAGFDRSEAVEASIRFILSIFAQASDNTKTTGKKDE
jgi:hypothetical protein